MKHKFLYILSVAVLASFVFSCTPYKTVPYFQDLRRDTLSGESIENYVRPTIQPGDLLGIHVTSENREADMPFNYNLERPNGTSLDRTEQNAVTGYFVDTDGSIKLPMIGRMEVKGLTTTALSRKLEASLNGVILKNPSVEVRFQNFRISVMGDVRNPGTFTIGNERITLTEAISMAGDLNITGLRNILLVRETEGKRQYIPIDLTSKKLFTSSYYYLQKNDVIYVTPNKSKAINDGATFQQASLFVSIASVIILLFR